MLIDNNTQLKLKDLISQTMITSIDDFPVDVEPNRIKEKKESLKNTLENRSNIPVSANYASEKKDVKSEKNNEKVNKVSYSVIDGGLDNIYDGGNKPINVNDTMFENIKKSSISNSVVVEKTPLTENDVISNRDVSTTKISSIEKLMEEVTKVKEEINDKMSKISSEKNEIEAMDVVIQELSSQYDQAAQELENAKLRENELQNQLISKLNSQIDSLNSELIGINKLSDEVDQKKTDTNNRVVEFKKKIASTQEEINRVNDEISKKEKMLSFFDEKSNSSIDEKEEDNVSIRRAA